WVVSKIFYHFDAVLYVGQVNRDYFRLHGVPEEKLFFAPHAVDNDRFQLTDGVSNEARRWRRDLDIPPDHLIVLFAGKFEEKKRPLDLLKAFSSLNHEKAYLLFVGAGVLEAEIREQARSVPNVFFAPFQN